MLSPDPQSLEQLARTAAGAASYHGGDAPQLAASRFFLTVLPAAQLHVGAHLALGLINDPGELLRVAELHAHEPARASVGEHDERSLALLEQAVRPLCSRRRRGGRAGTGLPRRLTPM
ncbi:MAG TPA: hypothetical protein VMU14_02460 [Acidimicrobiales bacterium]|nr:hypothetical protein [Acidimicrobiales bacterium]